ncbi:MAG: helix-turn-helix transcriptional regulator, partial [Chloroflexi bacterium]|nr:helix-turn-helix transcriptional regulator [Chloroflexota bacterium]
MFERIVASTFVLSFYAFLVLFFLGYCAYSRPNNYIGILQAIANGEHTQKEMVAYTGLQQGHISQYLSILLDARIVVKRAPVTASPRSRQARYHIGDPYLRFYYRFISNHQSQLDLGVGAQTIAEIKRHLV